MKNHLPCIAAVGLSLTMVASTHAEPLLAEGIAKVDDAERAPSLQELLPKSDEINARLGWWRETRFGMFVHSGVYSGLSGTWQGKKYGGYGEHIQRMAKS